MVRDVVVVVLRPLGFAAQDFLGLACVVSVVKFIALRSGLPPRLNDCQIQKEMKTSKDIGCGSATKLNIGSGSASHGIKVQQRLDHGQISIVCIGNLSTSVFSPDIVGEKVTEEFTIDAVIRERDVNHDERLEVVFAWYLRIVEEDGVKNC
ncbi:hypothetical protein NC651_000786 [Populus alba x Populus x berolinensis]|nr:hypothetical protein NC651_000786 [Populus alba x Populus x berolinensis]